MKNLLVVLALLFATSVLHAISPKAKTSVSSFKSARKYNKNVIEKVERMRVTQCLMIDQRKTSEEFLLFDLFGEGSRGASLQKIDELLEHFNSLLAPLNQAHDRYMSAVKNSIETGVRMSPQQIDALRALACKEVEVYQRVFLVFQKVDLLKTLKERALQSPSK